MNTEQTSKNIFMYKKILLSHQKSNFSCKNICGTLYFLNALKYQYRDIKLRDITYNFKERRQLFTGVLKFFRKFLSENSTLPHVFPCDP